MLEYRLQPIDDGTGVEKTAYLLECSCGGDIFYIFTLAAHPEHQHYQCAGCEQTYCTTGTCQIPKKQQETSETPQRVF